MAQRRLLGILLALAWAMPGLADEPEGVRVHVVKPGESLSKIA